MSKIHLEIFDEERKRVFDELKVFSDIGYLAGGTALALQLKHRISYDFDIFIPSALDNTLRQRIKTVFPEAIYSLNTTDQINLRTKENIKSESLSLATLDDIAADKATTIGRRAV